MASIDVILPTYNHGDMVPKAIESILHQTFTDFNLIIVNDGSTDDTAAVLKRFASSDPRILTLTHKVNRGLPATLNTGYAAGNSKYCTWVSSDNYSYPNHLQALYDEIIKGFDFVQGLYKVIHNDRTTINNAQTCQDNWGYGNLGATFLHDRKVWDTYKYDEKLHGAEDLKFFLQAWLHPFKFGFVNEVLVDYYVQRRSMSISGKLDHGGLLNKIHRDLFGGK